MKNIMLSSGFTFDVDNLYGPGKVTEEEIKAFLLTVDKLPTITIDYVPDTYKGIFWKEMFIRYGLKKTEDAKESAGSISVTPTKWYIT